MIKTGQILSVTTLAKAANPASVLLVVLVFSPSHGGHGGHCPASVTKVTLLMLAMFGSIYVSTRSPPREQMSTTGSADIVLDVEPLTTAAPKESSWPKVTGNKDVQAVPSCEFAVFTSQDVIQTYPNPNNYMEGGRGPGSSMKYQFVYLMEIKSCLVYEVNWIPYV